MKWSNLIPPKRSRYFQAEISETNWRLRLEKKIKRVLKFNAIIEVTSWLVLVITSAATIWFGWDLYGQFVHSLGDKATHLGFLWNAMGSFIHGNTVPIQEYLALLDRNGLEIHVAGLTSIALFVGGLSLLLFRRFLIIYELIAEAFVNGNKASHNVKESVAYLKKEYKGEKNTIQVSPNVSVPESLFQTHVYCAGTTGTGKTQILWNILTSLLSKNDDDFKLCLFDFKADFIQEYIHRPDFGLIAVYDQRSMFWDFMTDCKSTLDIEALAYQLIPAADEKDAFWKNTARNLVIDSIVYMKKAKLKGWATLYKLLGDRELILAAIEKSGGLSAQSIEKDNNTSNSVMTTLNESIRPISILAKAWADDGNGCKPISISKWVDNDQSLPKHLIFGWDEKYAQTLAPIFAAIMDSILAKKIAPKPENQIKIFMAWDEFASIPAKVTKLVTALGTGRSLGVSFFLGCLNINDIYRRYGKEEGKVMLSLLRTQFGLLVGSGDGGESAEYISKSWGEQTVQSASWQKVPVQYFNDKGVQKTRMEWEISWKERTRRAVGEAVFTEVLGNVRQIGCVEGYAKFENLKPCKLRWEFYTPKGGNPKVVPSPALMNEFDDIDVVANILKVKDDIEKQGEDKKPESNQAGEGLSDNLREKVKKHHTRKDAEPEFEEFPDDIDIPDDFEIDES
jgi:hypothetical protein